MMSMHHNGLSVLMSEDREAVYVQLSYELLVEANF